MVSCPVRKERKTHEVGSWTNQQLLGVHLHGNHLNTLSISVRSTASRNGYDCLQRKAKQLKQQTNSVTMHIKIW